MKKIAWIIGLIVVVVVIILISSKRGNREQKVKVEEIVGAGATFPYPFYDKIFNIYSKKTGVKINYQAIGSGGGIRQLLNKTVDFGATDAFMSDEEMKKAEKEIIHIPTCLGAVVVAYNLPGNPELKLTPGVIADIFLGKIKKWNDEKIKELNPDINLPDLNITVVRRSESSGTTFIFTDFLSKVSPEWKNKVGRGKVVKWPVGLGAKGNPGVAAMIKQTPGAIGYIEFTYASQNNIPFASIKNKSGNFIKPDIESISKAAAIELPPDTRISITNTESPDGYPISSFTWIIVYKEQNYNNREKEKAIELVKLLWWIIHEGQKYTKSLHYAPLPPNAVKTAEENIKSITYNGKSIMEELLQK